MNLSNNFTLAELCHSNTADRYGIINQLTDSRHLAALQELCVTTLQPLRDIWGGPIKITSGYRRPELNKALGGVSTSQHLTGEAADISVGRPADNLKLFDMAIKDNLPFDQLIDELGGSWLHISHRCGGPQRRQILRAVKNKNGKITYIDITNNYDKP